MLGKKSYNQYIEQNSYYLPNIQAVLLASVAFLYFVEITMVLYFVMLEEKSSLGLIRLEFNL